jgi:hypothetical protein
MIQVITFLTNHSVVADVSEKGDTLILKQPVQIVSGTSVGSYVFVPFLEYTVDFEVGIKIHRSHVLCVTEPLKDVYNEYNKRFGSGIVLASSVQ